MKKENLLLTLTLALALLLPVGGGALAQQATAKTLSMAVVDMRAILRDAEASKDLHQQLESRKQSYQKEISAEETRLRDMEDSLRKQIASAKGEDPAIEKKKQDFEKEVIAAQKMVQQHKRDLDSALDQSLDRLKDETSAVIAEIAKERGISVVLSREAVILGENSLDITAEVITRLNKKIKKIPLASKGKN